MPSGTGRGLDLDGNGFRLAGDADTSSIDGRYETEMVPTSGEPMPKQTKRNEDIDTVAVVDAAKRQVLRRIAESRAPIQMIYTDSFGAVFRALGYINIDTHTGADSRVNVKLMPSEEAGWTVFQP